MRCTVLNISAEGCAIEVSEPAFVPPRFRLVMADDPSIVRDCQVAWIQQNRIGLTFVEAPAAATRAAADPMPACPCLIPRRRARAVLACACEGMQ